jgi:hypothetical protein
MGVKEVKRVSLVPDHGYLVLSRPVSSKLWVRLSPHMLYVDGDAEAKQTGSITMEGWKAWVVMPGHETSVQRILKIPVELQPIRPVPVVRGRHRRFAPSRFAGLATCFFVSAGVFAAILLIALVGVMWRSAETHEAEDGQAPGAPSAPASTTSGPDAPQGETGSVVLGRIGKRAMSAGIALTVLGIDYASQFSPYNRARLGSVFLVVEVVVENVGRDSVPCDPQCFKVKDADGRVYKPELYSGDNGLKSRALTRRRKERGTVAFEVPQTASGFVLSYEPTVPYPGYQPIRFDLR